MRIQKNLLKNSKRLRTDQTPQEAKLWYHLRAKRFENFKFRRQVIIAGLYIVDFYCYSKKLVIEIDGGQHNEKSGLYKDEARDKHLRELGFTVLRFWNNDIDQNLDGVLEVIFKALTTSLVPPRTNKIN